MWVSIGSGNFQFTSLEKTGETGKDIKKTLFIFLLAKFCRDNFANRKLRNNAKKIEEKYITHLLEEIVSDNPSIFFNGVLNFYLHLFCIRLH